MDDRNAAPAGASTSSNASPNDAASRRRTRWRVTWIAVVVVSVASFTPLVIPAGTYEPMVAGLPYTLWVGFVATVVLVFLTYAATQLYPPGSPDGLEE